jgi:AAA ATPase-like protein
MRETFARADLLGEARRAATGPPLLLTGPAGSGKTTLLHATADALAAEGWQPVYLDLLTAATSPERFVQAALAALPEGPSGRAAARAREADQLSRAGRREGARAVQALLSAWAGLDTVNGRPVALLLDEPTEIRSLAYFSGLRQVDGPFGAAIAARPRGTILATAFPGLARRLWPQLATLAIPPVSASELQGEARTRGLRVDGSALAAASFGWPRYARILLDRLDQGLPLAAAWAEEMALGGRLEQACRHTYEVLLLRSRGYGMSKAVLSAVASEEGLNLTALVARLGRTPGAIRDYLGWLLAVDALRTVRKRYYYVDGLMRLWVRLHGRGVRATEDEILDCARQTLAAAAPPTGPEAGVAVPRHQGLMEID